MKVIKTEKKGGGEGEGEVERGRGRQREREREGQWTSWWRPSGAREVLRMLEEVVA